MKALTILQPFATLIALSEKTFETRCWKTDYTGELYIHAGKGKQYLNLCDEEPFKSVLAKYKLNKDNLPMGAIIAKTNLKECIPMKKFNHAHTACILFSKMHPNIYIKGNEIAFGDWDYGRYAWQLTEITPLETPIPMKGQQRLWNFDLR